MKCIRGELGKKLPDDPEEVRRQLRDAIDECTGYIDGPKIRYTLPPKLTSMLYTPRRQSIVSVHDYINTETNMDVDMREGDKYTTDSLMGEQIIVTDEHGNELDVWIKETPEMIQLSTIGAYKKSTGVGTKYLNSLKDYSDLTGKKLVIPDMTPSGRRYFRTKRWLVDDTIGLEYTDDRGEDRVYYAPNTMTYTPSSMVRARQSTFAEPDMKPDRTPTLIDDVIKTNIQTQQVQVECDELRRLPKITGPDVAADILDDTSKNDREEVRVLYLDNKNKVIGIESAHKGSINASLCEPHEVARFDDHWTW